MRRARARARTRAIRPSRAGGTTVLIGLPRGRNFPVVILPAPVPRAQNFLELAIGAAPTAAHQVPRILFAGRRVIIFPGSQ